MIRIFILLIAAATILSTYACKKDKADDCNPKDVSYTQDVFKLLESKGCYANGCHSGLDPVPLSNYLVLKVVVDANRLLGALKHQVGFVPMPQGGVKLSDCEIKTIETWINEGAKNN